MTINHIEQSGESDNRLLFYPTGSRNRTSKRTKFVTEFSTKSSEEVDFCRLNRPQLRRLSRPNLPRCDCINCSRG